MIQRARQRARAIGIACTIGVQHIMIPRLCPLLGIPIEVGTKHSYDNAPSLDRIDPSIGYVPGNVWVISNRANTIKSSATLAELQKITTNLAVKYFRLGSSDWLRRAS